MNSMVRQDRPHSPRGFVTSPRKQSTRTNRNVRILDPVVTRPSIYFPKGYYLSIKILTLNDHHLSSWPPALSVPLSTPRKTNLVRSVPRQSRPRVPIFVQGLSYADIAGKIGQSEQHVIDSELPSFLSIAIQPPELTNEGSLHWNEQAHRGRVQRFSSGFGNPECALNLSLTSVRGADILSRFLTPASTRPNKPWQLIQRGDYIARGILCTSIISKVPVTCMYHHKALKHFSWSRVCSPVMKTLP